MTVGSNGMLGGIPANQPVAPRSRFWIVVSIEHKLLSTADRRQERVPVVSTPPSEVRVVTQARTSSVGVKPPRESPAASARPIGRRKHKFSDGTAKGSGIVTSARLSRHIDRVARAKIYERVLVCPSPSRNDVVTNMPDLTDSKPAKEYMKIWRTGFELISPVCATNASKPPKEQEQITWTDLLSLEMSLGLVGLPE